MIKAIIFDLSGVLIEDPALKMLDYFRSYFGVKIETFRKVDPELLPKFQKGMVSEEQLWARICTAFKVKVPDVPSLWEEAYRSVYKPKEEMLSLAAQLKKEEYKVGLLSNSEIPAMGGGPQKLDNVLSSGPLHKERR